MVSIRRGVRIFSLMVLTLVYEFFLKGSVMGQTGLDLTEKPDSDPLKKKQIQIRNCALFRQFTSVTSKYLRSRLK